MNNEKLKDWALWLSLIIGFAIPASFAIQIHLEKLTLNIATWGMICLLDILGLILAFKSGNKKPWLQFGWAFAAVCIVIAILINNHTFSFGLVEYVCIACSLLAVYFWLTEKAEKGLYPYIIAVYISFIPQAIDYWGAPQPQTWWLWVGSILACVFAIYGAEKRNFANTFVPWSCIPFNLLGFYLVMR